MSKIWRPSLLKFWNWVWNHQYSEKTNKDKFSWVIEFFLIITDFPEEAKDVTATNFWLIKDFSVMRNGVNKNIRNTFCHFSLLRFMQKVKDSENLVSKSAGDNRWVGLTAWTAVAAGTTLPGTAAPRTGTTTRPTTRTTTSGCASSSPSLELQCGWMLTNRKL